MRDYEEWSRQAACLSLNPEDFSRPRNDYLAKEAKRVCQLHCPAKQACLTWAIIYNERGLWGGYLETERAFIGNDIREQLMEVAIQEGMIKPELIKDPVGVAMYQELMERIGPRKFVRYEHEMQGPMAA